MYIQFPLRYDPDPLLSLKCSSLQEYQTSESQKAFLHRTVLCTAHQIDFSILVRQFRCGQFFTMQPFRKRTKQENDLNLLILLTEN